ncbi:uncharacterized protein LOC101738039 [Bombyx mori]|uniref:Cuticle protein n=1 Tax=Bombyx mori TaxID=7091 RepID=A0A8R1WIL2_BOMMO|nr:uncharacterized protein LOC101738039 [Bombyx mori]
MVFPLLILFISLIYKVDSQVCPGPGQFFAPPNLCPYPGQIFPQLVPPCQEIIRPVESVISQPLYPGSPPVATTIIDNTVSNALANAIQLLIVSNLIENTMNTGICPGTFLPYFDSIIKPAPCNPIEYPTQVEMVTVNPCVCESPVIETVTPIYYDASPCPNFAQEVVQIQPSSPSFCSIPSTGFPCSDFLGPPIAPIATEVMFPSAIPAQLTCNFGYMNANVPCVSVNVEPAPYEPCSQFCNGPFY